MAVLAQNLIHDENKERAFQYKKNGWNNIQIAAVMGIDRATVAAYIQEMWDDIAERTRGHQDSIRYTELEKLDAQERTILSAMSDLYPVPDGQIGEQLIEDVRGLPYPHYRLFLKLNEELSRLRLNRYRLAGLIVPAAMNTQINIGDPHKGRVATVLSDERYQSLLADADNWEPPTISAARTGNVGGLTKSSLAMGELPEPSGVGIMGGEPSQDVEPVPVVSPVRSVGSSLSSKPSPGLRPMMKVESKEKPRERVSAAVISDDGLADILASMEEV